MKRIRTEYRLLRASENMTSEEFFSIINRWNMTNENISAILGITINRIEKYYSCNIPPVIAAAMRMLDMCMERVVGRRKIVGQSTEPQWIRRPTTRERDIEGMHPKDPQRILIEKFRSYNRAYYWYRKHGERNKLEEHYKKYGRKRRSKK